ncbi:MAG: hypothetical protein V8R80_00785 [Eubacterium sp.]
MSKKINDNSDLKTINKKRDVRRNTLPILAMVGPAPVWMTLFVTIQMLFVIYISFMSRGVFGDVVYKVSGEAYKMMLDPTYFKIILKSLKVALFTTVLCLAVGYPFAYFIARKPREVALKLITLIMIPFWTELANAIKQLAVHFPDKRTGEQIPACHRTGGCPRSPLLYARTGSARI